MKAKILFSLFLLCASVASWADSYDLTKLQPMYDDAVGYGYDIVDAPAAKTAEAAKTPAAPAKK